MHWDFRFDQMPLFGPTMAGEDCRYPLVSGRATIAGEFADEPYISHFYMKVPGKPDVQITRWDKAWSVLEDAFMRAHSHAMKKTHADLVKGNSPVAHFFGPAGLVSQ